MNAILVKESVRSKPVPKKREDWIAWRVDDDEVRVQVNRPDIAKAFARVKSARPVGHSVCGNYMRLFHVKQPVPWVDSWMKDCVRGLSNTPQSN
jgi:hypothetical protein